MNISFDLDSTLIPHAGEFEAEKRTWLAIMTGIEKIRLGAPKLISELQSQGHRVHIYTSSFRSKIHIRKTLLFYGIRVYKVINQVENMRVQKVFQVYASKYPPAFGFDVHIDDLKGVEMEGEKLSFKVIRVKPSDKNWTDTIKSQINDIAFDIK